MDSINNILNTTKTTRVKKDPMTMGLENYGKVPPQATEIEEIVLGALMLEKNAFTQVNDMLSEKVFYKPQHQIIYSAILSLSNEGEPIDILTVTNKLKDMSQLDAIGGPYQIAQLTSRVGSAANIEYHCRILQEKFIKREMIRISGEVITESFEDGSDVFDVLEKAEQGLFDISQGNLIRSNTRMSDLVAEAIHNIENAGAEERGLGVPSGFKEFDELTNGFQPSNLIIVAARPAMGKTAFALTIARNAAIDYKKPIALFSLEMDAIELVNRLISMETGVNSQKIKSGKLDKEDWNKLFTNVSSLSECPIFIDDTPGLKVTDFRSRARRLKQQYDIGMIIIDYLQLMRGPNDNNGGGMREQEISFISRSLKAIAKELRIPIIALSQLSRKVEETQDKRPQLSHLRESGAIEQDADIVCMLYRAEYYGIKQDEEGNPTDGVTKLIVAKNRHGAIKDISLGFHSELTKFHDFENVYVPSRFETKYGGSAEDDSNDAGIDIDKNAGPISTITIQSKLNDDDDIPF